MRAGEAPRLVVCDVDGTFVTSRDRVSPRTRGVVASLTAAGAGFMLATGRPPRWLLPVLDQVCVRPVCVCANGAVVYDAAADTVVHAETLAPDLLAAVAPEIARATAAVGGATFAVERVGRSAFDRADELFAVEPEYPHAWDTDEHSVQPRAELLAQPAVKLLVRNPALDSPELYALVREAVDPAVAQVTYSWGGGLLEVSAPGVSKMSGLQWALRHGHIGGAGAGVGAVAGAGDDAVTAAVADAARAPAGAGRGSAGGPAGGEPGAVEPRHVVAFGDMANDLEMIAWAGHGVAMGNAIPALKDAADEVTASNDDDGVARVLERWF